jgi:hypothetical protein
MGVSSRGPPCQQFNGGASHTQVSIRSHKLSSCLMETSRAYQPIADAQRAAGRVHYVEMHAATGWRQFIAVAIRSLRFDSMPCTVCSSRSVRCCDFGLQSAAFALRSDCSDTWADRKSTALQVLAKPRSALDIHLRHLDDFSNALSFGVAC